MFRKFSLLVLTLGATTQVQAADLFYGIGVINQEVDITVSGNGSTNTDSDSSSGLAVFADMYYQGIYRFNGTVSYVDYTNFYTLSATASADYLIPYDNRITFFAGVTGGGISQVYSDSSVSDMAISYLAGVQLGGIWLATDHIMVELGYRQRSTNLETDVTATNQVVTVDKVSESYLSVNFIF